jgi:protein SCO1/2
MFVKLVILLLLLIVVVSLLSGRRTAASGHPASSRVRPLMMKMALVLLVLGAVILTVHLAGSHPSKIVGEQGTSASNDANGSDVKEGFHATEIKDATYGHLSQLDGFTDHRGHRLATSASRWVHGSSDFSGKVVVVFFGYTQCPDICPTALSRLKETMQLLGSTAERVQVLFVTVDPARDTREVLAGYVPWFDPRFVGLFADENATREVARAFHVFYTKVPGNTALGYSIDHTATSYVFDTSGRLRLLMRDGTAPVQIAADLRQLLASPSP